MLYRLYYISPDGTPPETLSLITSVGFKVNCDRRSPEDFLKRKVPRGSVLFVDEDSASKFSQAEWSYLQQSDHPVRLILYGRSSFAVFALLPHDWGLSAFLVETREELAKDLKELMKSIIIERIAKAFETTELVGTSLIRSLLESEHEGVLVIGPSGRVLYSNIQAERFAGVRGGRFLGTKIFKEDLKYYDGNGRRLKKFEHPVSIAFHTGAVIEQFRFGVETPGGVQWYSLNAIPLRHPVSNRVRCVIETIRNESMEKTLRKELISTRLHFEKFLSTIPAIVYIVDFPEGKSRSLNRHIEVQLGYSLSELDGFTGDFLTSIMEEPYRSHVLRARAALLEGTGDSALENVVRLKAKDGHWRWFQIQEAIFQQSRDGRTHQLLGAGIDITDGMESSKVIMEQGQFIKSLFHRTPIMMLLCDVESLVTTVNEEFEQRTGFRNDDVRNKKLFDLIIPEDREMAMQFTAGLKNSERHEPFGARIRIADGSERYVVIASAWIKKLDLGDPFILTTLEDITEFRSLQEKLRESRRMDSLGSMAGGVAHDFNNLLQGLSNFNRLLKMELDKIQDSVGAEIAVKLSDFVANQRKLINRGSDITGQILEFSRKKELSPVTLDLGQELRDFLDLYAIQIPSGFKFEKSIDQKRLLVVGNRVSLQRLLQNLFTNAIQALEKSEVPLLRVHLSEEQIESGPEGALLETPPGRYGRLVFYDTGCGIAPEKLERIFDPFYSDRPNAPGTGLGLAVVYSTVRRMQGTIAIQTRVNEFTEITLYFPIAKEVEQDGVQEQW